MTQVKPSVLQNEAIKILVDLIGFTGVHRVGPRGLDIVLDLLPAEHALFMGGPFCVRITPNGVMTRISDEEAGVDRR